jgi:Mg-chelatase subunit ChlD
MVQMLTGHNYAITQTRGETMRLYLLALVFCVGCSIEPQRPIKLDTTKDVHPGTAVVVLIDTSGSMASPVNGGTKSQLAQNALDKIVDQSEAWRNAHPDQHLEIGVYSFADQTKQIIKPAEFDAGNIRSCMRYIPSPGGGTAIGRAIRDGFQALYETGCARKFLVCITDGDNTAGRSPKDVSSELFAQTNGAVRIEFVAFDTSAANFRFLNDVNGGVVEAADGAQLTAELTKIYGQKILVEAEDQPTK